MGTSTFGAGPSNSTDTTFRTWGGGVSAALAALGFVKTADTGQINWGTVLAPTVINTYQGYEVWRFNDSMQATAPIFIKIEFGAGSTATFPSIRLTVGKGSDGAGAITGTLLAATAISAGSGTSTSSNWYMSSGDGSILCFAPAPTFYVGGSGTQFWNFWIERSRSASGAATGTGVSVCWQTSSNVNMRTINYSTAVAHSHIVFPAAIPGGAALSMAGGGNTAVFPGLVADTAGNMWQPRAVLIGVASDIGTLSPITVQGFGVYLPITGWTYYDAGGNGTAVRAAIAWY